MPKTTLYQNIEITELPNSEADIKGEIPVAAIAEYRGKALAHLKIHTELPGFRKGHVPEKVLVEKLGEPAILFETAEQILQEAYPHLVVEKNIQAIGTPQISITKLAPGNPIGFTARTAVLPQFILPNYKTIAQETLKQNPEEEIIATPEEIERVLNQIRENKARIANKELEGKEVKKEDLPKLTDEDVKKLGDFVNLEDFTTKLRENIKHDKEARQKEARRMALITAILEKTTIPLPTVFVEAELDKIMHEFTHHLSSMGLSFEEYLKRVDKTEEALRNESRGEAERRAKLQLLLGKIAEVEQLKPDQEKVEHEVQHMLGHHKDADPERVRAYIETLFTNEKVYGLLEAQA